MFKNALLNNVAHEMHNDVIEITIKFVFIHF